MGGTNSHHSQARLDGFEAELHRIMREVQEVRLAPVRNDVEQEMKAFRLQMLNHRFRTITSDDYDLDCNVREEMTHFALVNSKDNVDYNKLGCDTMGTTTGAYLVDKEKKLN